MIFYTDGAASPNPGTGGWAVIGIENNQIVKERSGRVEETTNQRMEIMGVLNACQMIQDSFEINIIYTDSAYVSNCYKNKWYEKWLINNWKNSKKEPVANKDLWIQLIPYFKQSNIEIVKVKGHNGNHFNEIVDKKAVKARSSEN